MERFCASLACLHSSLELKRMATSVILYSACFYKIVKCGLRRQGNEPCPSTDSRGRRTRRAQAGMRTCADALLGDVCDAQSRRSCRICARLRRGPGARDTVL